MGMNSLQNVKQSLGRDVGTMNAARWERKNVLSRP
jgi:hypothetical protein